MHRLDSRTIIFLSLLAIAAPAIQAAEFSGYVTATTDYVKRGVSQSDSDPALQLAFDLDFDSGFYLGAWGSTVDIGSGPGRQRDQEVNYYVGFNAAVSDRWTFGTNVVAYTYPGMEGHVDYDYIEYALTANYDDTLWIEYAYSPDLFSTGYDTHNYEVHAERALFSAWLLDGGVGYYDVSQLSGNGYGYWELGLSHPVNQFEFDLRYHDTNRPVRFMSSSDRAKSRVVFSISYSF